MKDIKIENGHLGLVNGDLGLVDGKDRVIQQIIVGLKILKGDWYLDYRAGIDYINGLKAYPKILNAEIKKAIQEVVDVQNIRGYNFIKSGDIYKVSANVLINNQVYNISEDYKL